MRFDGYTRWVAICSVAVWSTVAQAQVVSQLNEQERRGTFEEIGSGSFTQFVGDLRVAFGGEELSGRYDGLWLRHVTAPRGIIQKLGFKPPEMWAISPDARYVAFTSDAQDLVTDKSNLCWHSVGRDRYALRPCYDLYLRNLATGSITRIHGPEQREIAADSGLARFSADGRWLVYVRSLAHSTSPTPQVMLHDREHNVTTSVSGSVFAHSPTVSRDATRVVFFAFPQAGTEASRANLMAHNRITGATERVDVDLPPAFEVHGFTAALSADGRYVAFEGWCNTCPVLSNPRVFIRDLLWKQTLQSVRAFDGGDPANGVDLEGISADGRFLLLESSSRDLVENDPSFGDVFVLDRITNTMVRVSQNLNGAQPNGVSFNPAMDSRARHVSFASQATNFLPYAVSPSVNLFLASLDLDNDGIHDSWERFFDGSPLLTGPELDDDGDGVSNLQEFERGTHPRGRFGVRIPILQEPPEWGLKLHNQTSRPATAVLRFVDQAGHGASRAFRIPALSGLPIRSPDIPDRPPVPYTIEIESDEPLFGLTRR